MATTPLVRPTQSQVKIEPTAKNVLSDGFNYPQFRLLNKKARITISKPYDPTPDTNYRLLAIANSRGWFVAARFNGSSYELVASTLNDLRSALKDAKDEEDNDFTPKRVVALQAKPNILTFANRDSILLVGLEQGSVLSFDSATLCTPGEGTLQPLKTVQLQSAPLRQILPNPGTEPNLVDKIAIVGNGTTQIFNAQLEPQGGWSASDSTTNPTTVAWSPKGKHIAIGLQTGDIMTFALTNMPVHHKHIPPTFQGILVSLSWTGPGHTFRTSYTNPQDPSSPGLHIVSLDTKTSTGVYYALNHPFVSGDRTFQSPHVLQLPKWDEDPGTSDHSKSLLVFGDASSVDLEVLAHENHTWYQQSQENPISLPLTKSMDDTMLLSLEADLTDTSVSTPTVQVVLNDGTIQGWYLEHPKPYPLMVSGTATVPGLIQSDASMSNDQSKVSAQPFGNNATTAGSTFGQSSFGTAQAPAAFGSTGFGQQTTSAFGQPSALGNTGSAAPSTSFSGFGSAVQGTPNAFGTSGAFGQGGFQTAQPSVFGGDSSNKTGLAPDMTREASMADDTPGFGGLSLGASNNDSSQSKSTSGVFGSFGSTASSTNSAFGGAPGSFLKPATGFGAFATNPDSPFSKASTASTTPTAFAGTPAFGTATSTNTPSSAFRTTGFGQTASPAFGQSGFGQTTSQSFGKSSFGTGPAFGQSAFGQSTFGQPSLAAPASSAAGGFSAFASKPASLTTAAKSETPQSAFGGTGGGFSSFAGQSSSLTAAANDQGTKSAFGGSSGGGFSAFANQPTSMSSASKVEEPKSSSGGGGFSAFANQPASLSAAPKDDNSKSVFGGTSSSGGFSAFSNPPSTAATTDSAKNTFTAFGSGSTSAFGSMEPPETPKADSPKTAFSAFGSGDASAFGAALSSAQPSTPLKNIPNPFGSSTPSPFGKTLASDTKAPQATTSVFGKPAPAGLTSPPSSPESAPASKSSESPSDESPPRPATTGVFASIPTTPSVFRPATGFGAFGSTPDSSSPFMKKDDKAPPVSAFGAFSGGSPKGQSSFGSQPVSVFGKPTTAPTFGSPSSLGSSAPKSVISPPTPPAPSQSTTKETYNAFNAFSGSPSAFGAAAAGSKTSFAELLKTGGDEAKDPSKSSKSATGVVPGPKSEDKTESDKGTGKPVPTEYDGEESKEHPRRDEIKKVESTESLGSKKSLAEISSAGSSYVDVKLERGEEEEGDDDGPPEDDRSDDYQSDDSFLTESEYNPASDDGSDDAGSEGEQEEPLSPPDSPTETPRKKRSPRERSPTATPGTPTETPKMLVTPSVEESSSESSHSSGSAPPGTPEPAPPVPSKSPSPSPVQPPFGIGLGRPSTRPTRSSPLANVPLSGDDEVEEERASDKDVPANKRPKTPPLLSTIAHTKSSPMPATPVLAPATPPIRPASTPSVPTPSIFGQIPKPTTASSSFFEASSTTKPSIFGTTGVQHTKSEPGTSLFGPTTSGQETPPFNLPKFSLASSAPSTAAATPTGTGSGLAQAPSLKPGFFGQKAPANSTPADPSTSPPATGSVFGQPFKITPNAPPFSLGTPQSAQAAPFSQATAPEKPKSVQQRNPAPPPEMTMEEGMQKECALLIYRIDSELAELRKHARQASAKLTELNKPAGGSWQREDLGDSKKWGLSDVKQFGQLMAKLSEDLDVLEDRRGQITQAVRELNSSLLKAGARREEIARFTRAQNDTEFSKMLKTRNLGPEHSEAQTHLRRTIRTVRDRISKLETHLQASKKKLAQSNSGKVSIKAPTLDVVNRTFRNIELAIAQQAGDVSDLATRVAKLNMNEKPGPAAPMTPVRDSRLPDPIRRQPYNVTPNVAAVTAAALNAERSAQRLKKALLAARKEPLLNVQVTKAAPPPVAFSTPFSTPKKPNTAESLSNVAAIPLNLSGFVFTPPPTTPQNSLSNWELPADDDFSPTQHAAGNRRGATVPKKHGTVTLKRTLGTTPPPADLAFVWGELPTFNHTPVTSLVANFKKTESSSEK
ncbi:hypothetical protein FA15DRAFT_692647 [Coprinopsis marcescibilis]|uniref:Nucleoporin Nup159/Nup146 N-terminal domain-containing protein n=1 Tax=Coprinopsis marcescibilis TaxID=230819 RepID=A0A5C3L302_COPMA|nr:hypothetical protein FA15DRAFT_692647 [Coprinopsis marcescibilis]